MRDFAAKILRQNLATHESNDAGGNDDQGKWNVKKIDGDKCGQGERPHDRVLERFASDPNNGRGDNRKNRRLQSVKDGGDPGDISKRDINVTEGPKNKDRWNNKERAGRDAAAGFVQKPADVNGQLDRLRTGQQHAKIEGVQKPGIIDPAFFLDHLRVHHRNLAGWSAERNESELQPKP